MLYLGLDSCLYSIAGFDIECNSFSCECLDQYLHSRMIDIRTCLFVCNGCLCGTSNVSNGCVLPRAAIIFLSYIKSASSEKDGQILLQRLSWTLAPK